MSIKTKTTSKQEEAKPGLVPKLRFPEFKKLAGWNPTPLNSIADPVMERATQGDDNNVLSLSAEHGIVLQSEFFGKKVAGDNPERYLKITRDDFVYNDRTTKASTFGTIKRLSKHSGGIVSPIYKCFRFHADENPLFWEQYFESGYHDPALRGLVNEGARAGRFNISISQFLSTAAFRPSEKEQQKIAECLSSVDELIATQARKVEALKSHKKGLMQQLFPREGETHPSIRFSEFKGEWNDATLEDLCLSVSSGKDARDSDGLFDLYGSTGIIGKTLNASYYSPHILVARVGANAGYLTKASGQFGVTDNTLVVSLKPAVSIDFIFYSLGNININKLIFGSGQPLITGSILKSQRVLIPSSAEQSKISTCLSSISDLIKAESDKLEVLNVHKNGLMQQLFPSAEEVAS